MDESNRAMIREANTGSDHAFLYSTWRNALWFAEKRDSKDSDQFYKEASEKIAKLLKRPDIRIRVACLQSDPDMLLGWAVLEKKHLHFVYVKIDYRKQGLGKLLIKGATSCEPPETKIGKALVDKVTQEINHGRKEETQTQPY